MPRSMILLILLVLGLPALACNLPRPTPTPIGSLPPGQVTASWTPFSPATRPPSHTPTSEPSNSPTPPPPAPTATATSTPAPRLEYQPIFEPLPCRFPIPGGYFPECGDLVVPENRLNPASRFIRLHVAIFRSPSPDRRPDPLIHLAGGPGGSSLDTVDYLFQTGFDRLLAQRELIFFDQRGTGFSQPALNCPERAEAAPVLLEGHQPPGEDLALILDAFRRCRDRLVAEGTDLAAYNSAASAADVADLRRALGYEQVNLYGDSYGTRLALTMLRDQPEGVRSAILDSAYPPQVDLYTGLAPNAERAFTALFELCDSTPACRSAYPDLEEVFYEQVDRLNQEPWEVAVPLSWGSPLVKVDGSLLVDVLFVGLYNREVTRSMPRMIYQVRRGEPDILARRLRLYFTDSTALGMQTSVQCREEAPFGSADLVRAAAEGVRRPVADFFAASVARFYAVCREWPAGPPDPLENQAVSSPVPALVLAGLLDPITPPEWGELALQTLPNGYYYEFPAVGHWVARSGPCGLDVIAEFLADPNTPPAAACLAGLGGLGFE